MNKPTIPQVVADLPRIGYRIVQTAVEYNSDRAAGASLENPHVVLRLESVGKDAMGEIKWNEQECWISHINRHGDAFEVPPCVLFELIGSVKLGRSLTREERLAEGLKEERTHG